ncbi:MAG: hypothetical protein AAGC74_11365 [Verrucomicrobiota bacterium]
MERSASGQSGHPWLAGGSGVILGLLMLLLNLRAPVAGWLRGVFEGAGFPAMETVAAGGVFTLGVLVGMVALVVWGIEGSPGVTRRVMLLISGLILVATMAPILALWGRFWDPVPVLFALVWAGAGAILDVRHRERLAEELAGSEKVISIEDSKRGVNRSSAG